MIKKFKDEYRLIFYGDFWGSAMEAWFECAGQMYVRGIHIPVEWEYMPGNEPTDEESYWHYIFVATIDEQLIAIGDFLTRYCQMLKYYGKDY